MKSIYHFSVVTRVLKILKLTILTLCSAACVMDFISLLLTAPWWPGDRIDVPETPLLIYGPCGQALSPYCQ